MKIELGSTVRDTITGFEGIATIYSLHITGCERYWVEGKLRDDGKLPELWLDSCRLEVISASRDLVDTEEVATKAAPVDCAYPK